MPDAGHAFDAFDIFNAFDVYGVCDRIGLPKEAVNGVSQFINRLLPDAERLSRFQALSEGLTDSSLQKSVLEDIARMRASDPIYADMLALLLFICAYGAVGRRYEGKSIPRPILDHTLSDIAIWAVDHHAKTGNWGLSNVSWLSRHINGTIFRLGRLQFEMNDPANHTLSVHIPRDGKLIYEECQKSYADAKAFFNAYFSEYRATAFVCFSWLLFPGLKQLLPGDSNIIRFQNDYRIEKTVDNHEEAIEQIFGKVQRNIDDYPTDSSLQRAAVDYMKKGGVFGVGHGTLIAPQSFKSSE